jgi:hypothetical protein
MRLRGRTLILKVRPLFFVILLLFSLPITASASESAQYIQKAHDLRLGEDHFWRSLLHFKGKSSQILGKDFFLSAQGRFDAQAELDATIDAYFTHKQRVEKEIGDKAIVCIFPARYMWLNQKLGLPNYQDAITICPALNDWARLNEIQSVSVLYVSGYLGNPASSFGHVLLNFKTENSDTLLGLSDTSISFGAIVPAHENMMLYILKGLFGGYYSTFSDKYFYAHDQVYSNKEFRDIWEYSLNLSEFDKKMLIYHIAELLTMRYRYFFLNANCAHRIAILLDIFIKESVYNHDYPIYVPEELFHRLEDIDSKRQLHGEQKLIKKIKYIPSARRHLFYETHALSKEELKVYSKIVSRHKEDFRLKLKEVNEKSRIKVLDALLAYQYYKLMASDEGKEDRNLKEYKDKILRERIMLPSEKEEPVPIPEVPSPKEVSPPSSFNISYVTGKGHKPFTMLGATVFRKESVGLNALEYNELVALDMDIGFTPEHPNVFVDKFDFIRIKDFKTFYIKEAQESPFSWRLRSGMDRYDIDNSISYDFLLDGGGGLVRKAGNVGIYYGFLNTSLHTRSPYYRAGPSTGFVIGGLGPVKAQLNYGLEFDLRNFDYMPTLESKVQYQINPKNAIQLVYEKNDRERLTLNYIYYW